MGNPIRDPIIITDGFLNDSNDPAIARSANPDSLWGFDGMLGQIFAIDGKDALRLSNTTIGTLYGGYYQIVKANTALAKGDIVAWESLANDGLKNFLVTHTITAPLEGKLAGIALNTVTINQYCFIQVKGLATVKWRASVTSKIEGNLVLQLTTTATADAIADATGTYITGGTLGLKNILGTAYDVPVDGGLSRIQLNNIPFNFGAS